MEQKIRTAWFGGSFNPIHEGHLALGDFVIEQGMVDECWFVVSPQNPLKPNADASDAQERYRAVERAITSHSGCKASNFEFELPLPNFTASSLRAAVAQYPNRSFVLLIGGDNLDVFTKWKEYTYLLDNFDILVYPRPGATNCIPENWTRVQLLKASLMNISSTQIRTLKF